jgi:hypothetical protein
MRPRGRGAMRLPEPCHFAARADPQIGAVVMNWCDVILGQRPFRGRDPI